MKVKVCMTTTDGDGNVMTDESIALLDIIDNQYKIVYAQNLSDSGKKTRTTILLSKKGLKLNRNGEINSNFEYEEKLVHNSQYGTLYGTFPITVETIRYSFLGDIFKDGICVDIDYLLDVGQSEIPPAKMNICINIKRI